MQKYEKLEKIGEGETHVHSIYLPDKLLVSLFLCEGREREGTREMGGHTKNFRIGEGEIRDYGCVKGEGDILALEDAWKVRRK